jgi:hypothetical protein
VGPYNTILGLITDVSDRTSLVSLLWNGNEITGRTSASGTVITLRGVDSGVYASQVPHEMDFEVGDVILYDANPELIIGTVKKINNNEEDRFKEIIVNIPFHPNMIDVVGVESGTVYEKKGIYIFFTCCTFFDIWFSDGYPQALITLLVVNMLSIDL